MNPLISLDPQPNPSNHYWIYLQALSGHNPSNPAPEPASHSPSPAPPSDKQLSPLDHSPSPSALHGPNPPPSPHEPTIPCAQ
ncbi:hypothetical protein LIER_40127 [Lithospermum erythrorhizon]|uniref:Uncharacterized protein n=1 Tax=Lithospermum erythrorhizon TaxID=34254 RepID=A0AAV3QT57_LITER